MSDFDKLNFKPGDPVRARDFQAIVDEIRHPGAVVGGGGGVDVRQGPRGQLQISAPEILCFVGVANGDISPRSGTTWGTGTVTVLGFDGTDDYSLSVDYDVVNPSSTVMTSGHGIDSGMYCWVQEDIQGNLIVTPLECA